MLCVVLCDSYPQTYPVPLVSHDAYQWRVAECCYLLEQMKWLCTSHVHSSVLKFA